MCHRLIRTYEKPCLLFLSATQLLPFALLQFYYNRILLKHALNISTHNLRQSTLRNLMTSLCDFEKSDVALEKEIEEKEEEKFVVISS